MNKLRNLMMSPFVGIVGFSPSVVFFPALGSSSSVSLRMFFPILLPAPTFFFG